MSNIIDSSSTFDSFDYEGFDIEAKSAFEKVEKTQEQIENYNKKMKFKDKIVKMKTQYKLQNSFDTYFVVFFDDAESKQKYMNHVYGKNSDFIYIDDLRK